MAAESPRILCVAHQFPLPADNGTAVRQLGLLGLLIRIGEVRLVTRPRSETSPEDLEAVRAAGVVLRLAPTAAPAPWRGPALWARSLARRTPPWVVMWHDAGMTELVRDELAWCTHLFPLEEFAADHLLHLDVPADRHVTVYKDLVYANPRSTTERIASGLRAAARQRVTAHHERRMLAGADTVIVNTDVEAEACARILGRRPEVVLPNGIDLPAEWTGTAAHHRRVLWMGTLDNDWNRGGLVRLATAIQDAGLGVTLTVAGRGADDEVVAAVGDVGEFLGYVPDLDALAAGCAAAVVPVWGGGGGRVKTLVLLGSGIPVVASPMAMEGTGAVDGVHCRIGETAEDLVALLDDVLAHPEEAAAMGARARRLVAEQHTWESRLPLLRRALGLDPGQGSSKRSV